MKFLRFNTLFLLVFLSGLGEVRGGGVSEGKSSQNERCDPWCKFKKWIGEAKEQDLD